MAPHVIPRSSEESSLPSCQRRVIRGIWPDPSEDLGVTTTDLGVTTTDCGVTTTGRRVTTTELG
jgi:hypothetical protein